MPGAALADEQLTGSQGCYSTVQVKLKNLYFPKHLSNHFIISVEKLHANLQVNPPANTSHTQIPFQKINFYVRKDSVSFKSSSTHFTSFLTEEQVSFSLY